MGAISSEKGIFNAGTGIDTSVLQIAEQINMINGGGKIIFNTALLGDASASKADTSLIQNKLGVKCEVNINEGLKSVFEYFQTSWV